MKALIYTFLLLTASCSSAASQVFHRYIAPLENEVVVIVPEENLVLNGPYGDEIEICDNNSKFICINHPIFWVSIPKAVDSLNDGDTWEHQQAKYKLLTKFQNYKFKKYNNSDAFIIKGETQEEEIYFLYIKDFGVVYRETNKSTAFRTLVLDGETGFGAQ